MPPYYPNYSANKDNSPESYVITCEDLLKNRLFFFGAIHSIISPYLYKAPIECDCVTRLEKR